MSLVDRMHQLSSRFERWDAQREALLSRLSSEEGEFRTLSSDVKEISGAVALLQYVAEQTSKTTEEQTAALVTLALQETFHDQDLSLLLEHENKRGQPSVTFILRDNTGGKGIEGELLDSFGGGPVSLIGPLLQIISTVRQKNMDRILILDEPVAQVSAEYQEATGKLFRKLCEPPEKGGLGFKMLVITHMEALAQAAHKRYRAVRSADNQSVSFVEEKE